MDLKKKKQDVGECRSTGRGAGQFEGEGGGGYDANWIIFHETGST